MAFWSSLGFQDGGSPLMEELILFYDLTMVILTLIITIVGYFMMNLMFNSYINRFMLENQTIEVIWTVIPGVILLFVALPSLRLLYLLDEVNSPNMTLKVVGHQWYWSYEYSDFKGLEFDSYMTSTETLNPSGFRVLEVDHRAVMACATQTRALVSASDVIHSWTIPSLGVKVDAVPGRLNQLNCLSLRPGVMYGQCSEICGANHSFMPVVVESVPIKAFVSWLKTQK